MAVAWGKVSRPRRQRDLPLPRRRESVESSVAPEAGGVEGDPRMPTTRISGAGAGAETQDRAHLRLLPLNGRWQRRQTLTEGVPSMAVANRSHNRLAPSASLRSASPPEGEDRMAEQSGLRLESRVSRLRPVLSVPTRQDQTPPPLPHRGLPRRRRCHRGRQRPA